MKEPFKEICKEYLEEVFHGIKEVFGDGIFVKSAEHPCGWDFISCEQLEVQDDIYFVPIEISEISNYCYSSHPLENLTLAEIIKEVGMDGWCFELSGVDYLK